MTDDDSRPLLQVLTPDATEEEIAALVAVFAATGADDAPPARRTPSWNAPARLVRRPLQSGPGAWRASSLPL